MKDSKEKCKKMTVDEYINNNLPFYHVTAMSNLDSIKLEGLKTSCSGSRAGICVIRSDNERLIYEIIDCYLHTLDVLDDTCYALIKIIPNKHNITSDVVAPDPIDEPRAKCYNYLCVTSIKVTEEDIVRKEIPIGEYSKCKGEETDVCECIELENYHITPPQFSNTSNS